MYAQQTIFIQFITVKKKKSVMSRSSALYILFNKSMNAFVGLGALIDKFVSLQNNTTLVSLKMLALLSVEWSYPLIKDFENPSPPIGDTLKYS